MGLIEMASGSSVWRGMDYYERKMVCSWKKSGEEAYDGVVSGSEGNKYSVHIDKVHPRKSSCNCPFAEGSRVICKHLIYSGTQNRRGFFKTGREMGARGKRKRTVAL